MRNPKLIFLTLVGLVLLSGYLVADWYSCAPDDVSKSYVGRESCAQCHSQQCADFVDSHHDKAMDDATEQSVLGDFNDVAIEHYGVTSRMFRDGSKFMINTEGPDGNMQDFEVKYVFGVTPLQQYMVEIDRPQSAADNEIGRVQVLRVSWDTLNKKWFYLTPPDVKEKLDVDDPLHWTGITQNWNTSCAECHSTNLQKNYRLSTNQYHTTFSEIDVSCEACHGPASLHLDLASSNSFFWDRKHGMGLAKLKTNSNVAQVESCAPCHSRRSVVQEGFQPGCNFDEFYSLQLLNVPIYHADGQIRDEDYVYGSFIQSKMYHQGIKCSDCHNPHSAKLIHNGNNVCTSCHQHSAGKYDSPAHHHHQTGTAGAACVNCHMPATTYMDLDSRRDHSFRVPRPDLSLTHNSPNACTACHLKIDDPTIKSELQKEETTAINPYLDLISAAEQGDEAATRRLRSIDEAMVKATETWYPEATSPPKTAYYRDLNVAQQTLMLERGRVAASAVAALSTDENAVATAAKTLVELADDARNPAIFRATAMNVLSGSTDQSREQSLDVATKLLKHSDVKIASSAIGRLEAEINWRLNQAQERRSSGTFERTRLALSSTVNELGTILTETESFRLRTEAARALSLVPISMLEQILTSAQQTALQRGLKDYRRSLKFTDDLAGVHLMLGALNERLGEPNDAIQDYRNAIAIEPTLVGPRSNLAALLEQKSGGLQQQMGQMAQSGQISQSQMGAIVSQMKTLRTQVKKLRDEEYDLLKRDVERTAGMANTDWLNYRFGMASYLQGDLETAQQQLEIAVEKSPSNETNLLGLATFYVQVKKFEKARPLVERLLTIAPENIGYQRLQKQIAAEEK